MVRITAVMLICLIAPVAANRGAENAISDHARRPNFVVILTDDQRADALGCAGNAHIRTPNIDALAESGVRFANAFVTTSICSPSRAALLTGRYGSANGVTSLRDPTLNPGERTWPQILKTAGYRTTLVGKWHLKNPPETLGVDDVICFDANGPYRGREVREHGRRVRIDEHLDDYVAQQAERFLKDTSAGSEPFALLLCTQSPHMDPQFRWDAKPETLQAYDAAGLPVPASWADDLTGKPPYLKDARHRTRAVEDYEYNRKEKLREHKRAYYAAITDMDAALGRVLRTLKRSGLRANTYVIFTSDNGWFLGEHRFTSKVLAYEESIRVPLIICGPGIMPGTNTSLVLNIDIAPTLLDLAGVPIPANMHGISLAGAITGKPDRRPRTSVLYEAMEPELGSWPLLALRTDQWKYIRTFTPGTRPPQTAFEELYDLTEDAGEMENLAGSREHAQTLRQMRDELDGRRAETRPAADTRRSVRIDAEFPGGNIIVDKLDGDRVYVRPDLRDTPRWWFYWYFRVREAGGRTLTFEFVDGNAIGVRGPAVSSDGGRTWSWLGAASVNKASFRFTFPRSADDVRFAFTIPYLQADLEAFLRPLRAHPNLKVKSLCRTTKGRDVEALRFGRLDDQPDHRVLITARHHACEAMASYVLEGLVLGVLQDENQQWLRDHVEFLAVPFMDKDGVEQGDQGKLRSPHDPNRDYDGRSIYPAVAALRDRVPAWADGRLRIALDLHCPYIRGPRNEAIYFVGLPDERSWRGVQRFAGILESLPPEGLPYHVKDNLPFGQEWNMPDKLGEGKSMARWAAEIPGIEVASTIEIPYANVSGAAVTPESARAFGRDLARAVRRFFCASEGPDARRNKRE